MPKTAFLHRHDPSRRHLIHVHFINDGAFVPLHNGQSVSAPGIYIYPPSPPFPDFYTRREKPHRLPPARLIHSTFAHLHTRCILVPGRRRGHVAAAAPHDLARFTIPCAFTLSYFCSCTYCHLWRQQKDGCILFPPTQLVMKYHTMLFLALMQHRHVNRDGWLDVSVAYS